MKFYFTLRNLLLLITIFVLNFQSMQAQESGGFVTITDEDGISSGMFLLGGGGSSGSILSTDGQKIYNTINGGAGISASGGLFYSYGLSKNKLSFVPEILINGEVFNNFYLRKQITDSLPNGDSASANNGISKFRFAIPLLLKINLTNKFRFFIGPKIDYNFSITDNKYKIINSDLSNFGLSATAGLEYKITEVVRLQLRYSQAFLNVLNTQRYGNLFSIYDGVVEAGLSLTFYRQTSKYLNAKDIKREIESFKSEFIKSDSDGDGVLDESDNCINVPGPITNKGCPLILDTDKDGVIDAADKCPTIKGLPSNGGCPLGEDKDKDGVIDSKDACPTIYGVPTNKGCPVAGEKDSDRDGVIDSKDACPAIPGSPVNMGCPLDVDSDKDGVIDSKDACPTIPGLPGRQGCPEQSLTEIFKEALKGIQFETGKSIIKPVSYIILDKVVGVLLRNPNFRLVKIFGHTDNVGNANKNLILSKERAIAVRDYLVNKNIPAAKLKADGFGDTKPIVPNTSVQGKDQNRRVEFELIK